MQLAGLTGYNESSQGEVTGYESFPSIRAAAKDVLVASSRKYTAEG
jgi:hypothetical protein